MKAIMIVFSQALSEDVVELFDELDVRGFTKFNNLQGRGSAQGEPRMGTHTWPALNNAILTVAEDEKAATLISRMNEMNKAAEEQGLKAFSWPVDVEVE